MIFVKIFSLEIIFQVNIFYGNQMHNTYTNICINMTITE